MFVVVFGVDSIADLSWLSVKPINTAKSIQLHCTATFIMQYLYSRYIGMVVSYNSSQFMAYFDAVMKGLTALGEESQIINGIPLTLSKDSPYTLFNS